MTRFASRTDFHYLAAFLAGIVITFLGSSISSTLVWLIPMPLASTLVDLQIFSNTINSLNMALTLALYGAGFIGLAMLLKRIGGQPRAAGLRLAVVVVICLQAALMLTTLNVATVIRAPLDDSSVWLDLLVVTSCGLFYAVGWFLTIRYGKSLNKGKTL